MRKQNKIGPRGIVGKVEREQMRFMRMMPGMIGLMYEEKSI